jgi:hypothetical protein
MRDDSNTFILFKTLQLQWSVICQFVDLEITIWENLSPTVLGCSAVCHNAEICRQDRIATLSDDQYSVVEPMDLIFLFDVLLVSEEHLITKSAHKDSDLRNRRPKRNHREPTFTSCLVKAIETFPDCLNSFQILDLIKPF